MFCPQCKAEYRAGFVHCTDCNVDLESSLVDVHAVEAPEPKSHSEQSALLWRGQDPVAFSVVLSALDAEGIPYREVQRRDYAAALSQPVALGFYGLPHWEVRVCASDLIVARIVAEQALQPAYLVAIEPAEENDAVNSETAFAHLQHTFEKLNAPVKIWSGEVVSLAHQLRDALVTQAIRCWTLSSSPSGEHLLVSQEDEARARAILHAVLERTSAA
jgi:hypothetical protein